MLPTNQEVEEKKNSYNLRNEEADDLLHEDVDSVNSDQEIEELSDANDAMILITSLRQIIIFNCITFL